MVWCMVDAQFGTGVGAWLMHGSIQLWCMVDAWFGIGCSTRLMLGMVEVDGLVHALVHG
jgi:hypothetical protein